MELADAGLDLHMLSFEHCCWRLVWGGGAWWGCQVLLSSHIDEPHIRRILSTLFSLWIELASRTLAFAPAEPAGRLWEWLSWSVASLGSTNNLVWMAPCVSLCFFSSHLWQCLSVSQESAIYCGCLWKFAVPCPAILFLGHVTTHQKVPWKCKSCFSSHALVKAILEALKCL